MHKRLISLLLAFVLVLGVLPVAASALSASDTSGAADLQLGKTYSHTWPKPENWYDNYDSVFYKLTLDQSGILTINLARPYDVYGTSYEDVYIRIYSASNTSDYICSLDSDYATDIDKENCTMQYCLSKGTYYVEITPDYYINCDNDLTATYSFTLDAKAYTEVEKNNSRTTATPMELGHMYYGTASNSDNYDYYSFNTEAGHKYVVTFDNFAGLDKSNIIFKIHLPGGTKVSPLYYAEDYVDANGMNYYIFEAKESGLAFVEFDNSTYSLVYGIRMDDAATYHTHTYVPTVTLPTCGKDGYTTYNCACGESYTDDAMPATGLHTYENEYDEECNRCSAKREAPTDNSNWGDLYTDVGDYASKATLITPRGAAGYLIGDDEDWYKFEVTQKSKVSLWGGSEWEYIHYYIYNADRSLVWKDTYWGFSGSTHHQRRNATLEPGTYYVRVFNLKKLDYVDLVYSFSIKMTHVHEHSYTTQVYAPSCCKQGYTVYTCACGHTYKGDNTPISNNHSYTGADCNAAQTCMLCGAASNGPVGHRFTDNVDGTCNYCNADRAELDASIRQVVHMFRMYNPNTGEHFYTGSTVERDNLITAGWQYEGIGFTFPANTGDPVHRLFQPSTGEHLYTMDEAEKDRLMANGWNYEGIAFNSAYDTEAVQHRLHNPNASVGAYHFTFSEEEKQNLIAAGWEYQGIGWYSCWK